MLSVLVMALALQGGEEGVSVLPFSYRTDQEVGGPNRWYPVGSHSGWEFGGPQSGGSGAFFDGGPESGATGYGPCGGQASGWSSGPVTGGTSGWSLVTVEGVASAVIFDSGLLAPLPPGTWGDLELGAIAESDWISPDGIALHVARPQMDSEDAATFARAWDAICVRLMSQGFEPAAYSEGRGGCSSSSTSSMRTETKLQRIVTNPQGETRTLYTTVVCEMMDGEDTQAFVHRSNLLTLAFIDDGWAPSEA